jgi:hypothetical protein
MYIVLMVVRSVAKVLASWLLILLVRIPLRAWKFVPCLYTSCGRKQKTCNELTSQPSVSQAWALQQRCYSRLKKLLFVSARFQFPFLHIRIVDLDNFLTFYTDCGSLRHDSVNTDCTYALDTLAPVILAAMYSYPVIPVATHSYPVAT